MLILINFFIIQKDSIVLDYLESRGFEYSASTLCDEAGLDPNSKPSESLIQILSGQAVSHLSASTSPRPDLDLENTLVEQNSIQIENVENQIAKLSNENEKLKELIGSKNEELEMAQSEIQKFSQNFVNNILDVDLPMPGIQDVESDEELDDMQGRSTIVNFLKLRIG